MKKLNQKGIASLELVLIVIVLSLIGFVGYYVMSARSKTTKNTEPTSVKPSEPTTAPEIKSSKDLSTASSDLDKMDTDMQLNELNQIEKEVGTL